MPTVSKIYTHSLKKEEAWKILTAQTRKLLEAFEGQDINLEFEDTTFSFSCKSRGFSITGDGELTDTEAKINVKLPMLAIAFKGKTAKALDVWIGDKLNVSDVG